VNDPYSHMIQKREEIKTNTNKVNCFVDENEPAFINTMSRTMDAYDLRMSTFGGKSKKDKEKNYDKFISEKRGFIRTSNGYVNNDITKIIREETIQQVDAPGPAFITNYDNKYNQWDVFANDEGRYKQALNTNKHDETVLKGAERSKYQGNLKLSSIKFDQDEMGSPMHMDKLKTLTPSM
jgi:hypothetical protein